MRFVSMVPQVGRNPQEVDISFTGPQVYRVVICTEQTKRAKNKTHVLMLRCALQC